MTKFFRDFRIVDSEHDFLGGVFVENGRIAAVIAAGQAGSKQRYETCSAAAHEVLSGNGTLVLMPGFIDLHAHFREPGFPLKETLESASLAAVRGGWTTAVAMANTNPPTDNIAAAQRARARARAIGLIDLYPAVSLTKEMRGETLVDFNPDATNPDAAGSDTYHPPLFSEDGKDIPDDRVFLSALCAAGKTGSVISCHCDADGEDAATRRALALGKKAGCRLHIAHVSTEGAAQAIREAKQESPEFCLSAEATPHHIALTSAQAQTLGADSFGKVAPPLRTESDRRAVIEALRTGIIDAIATDHAPHRTEEKEQGAPGFIGFETAFSVLHTVLVHQEGFSLCALSALLSAGPARILRLHDRGKIAPALRADLTIVDTKKSAAISADTFASRSQNTPFRGMNVYGEVLMTVKEGRVVYEGNCS